MTRLTSSCTSNPYRGCPYQLFLQHAVRFGLSSGLARQLSPSICFHSRVEIIIARVPSVHPSVHPSVQASEASASIQRGKLVADKWAHSPRRENLLCIRRPLASRLLTLHVSTPYLANDTVRRDIHVFIPEYRESRIFAAVEDWETLSKQCRTATSLCCSVHSAVGCYDEPLRLFT